MRTNRVCARAVAVKSKVNVTGFTTRKEPDKTTFPYKLLDSAKLKLKSGAEVKIQFGKIVKEFTY